MVTWLSTYMDAVLKMFREKNKEIELYKHTLEHDTKEIKLLTAEIDQKDEEIERLSDLNKAKSALIKAQAKAIGRLLKEKEWLINDYTVFIYGNIDGTSIEEGRKRILEAMQQALKER